MAAGKSLEEIKKDLVAALAPIEGLDKLFIITDERTGARYCDCHVLAMSPEPRRGKAVS